VSETASVLGWAPVVCRWCVGCKPRGGHASGSGGGDESESGASAVEAGERAFVHNRRSCALWRRERVSVRPRRIRAFIIGVPLRGRSGGENVGWWVRRGDGMAVVDGCDQIGRGAEAGARADSGGIRVSGGCVMSASIRPFRTSVPGVSGCSHVFFPSIIGPRLAIWPDYETRRLWSVCDLVGGVCPRRFGAPLCGCMPALPSFPPCARFVGGFFVRLCSADTRGRLAPSTGDCPSPQGVFSGPENRL
jgi:hypothetical protein